MSQELSGIKLETLEDPIRIALREYEKISDGLLQLDENQASQLALTPDKPNSARSATDFRFQGETIGKLFVIAFKPGDGSGDESGYKLKDLTVDTPYARTTRVVPRNKTGTNSEGHLTVVRHKIEDPNADPELFAGTFDLLELDGRIIRKIGELGQAQTVSIEDLKPLTTLTVGHRTSNDGTTERFGDPHAVYSSVPDAVQVCAFLGISDEMYQKYGDILSSLHPQEPRQASS